ncbi:MAG: T9SS type A sorting domain-containing protein [Chitinophagales bacterium]|nr:T9SS type A sorting domain-containing protein [Chitinophagales bacterium]
MKFVFYCNYLFLSLLCIHSDAQPLISKQVTNDSFGIMPGIISPLSDQRHFLLTGQMLAKVDDHLNPVWSTFLTDSTPNTSGLIFLEHGIQLTDGSIIVCGYELHGRYGYALLIKIDDNGNIIWTKTYKRDGKNTGMQPFYIDQLPNSNIVILGHSGEGRSHGDRLMWLETDTVGTMLQFREIYSTGKSYTPVNIFAQPDNSSIIAAYYGNFHAEEGTVFPYLLHLDQYGNVIQWRGYGFDFSASMTDCIQLNNGGFRMIGLTTHAAYLMEVDSSLNFKWIKTYPDSLKSNIFQSNGFQSLQNLTDGSSLIAGSYPIDSFTSLPFYMRTDSSGNVIYAHVLNPDSISTGYINGCLGYDHPVLLSEELFTNFEGNKVVLSTIDASGVSACPFIPVSINPSESSLSFILDSARTEISVTASLLNNTYNSVLLGTYTDLCEQVFTSSNSVVANSHLNLFPNPATDEVTIEIPDGVNYTTLFIYNASGLNLVKQIITPASGLTINTSSFSSGLYAVILRKNDGSFISSKFLKK